MHSSVSRARYGEPPQKEQGTALHRAAAATGEDNQVLPTAGEGELILFDGAPRSATATALEQTLLVAIERDGLARLLKREADLAAKLLWSIGRVMAGRLRSTTYSLTAQS